MRLIRILQIGAVLTPLVGAHMRLLKPRRFGTLELGPKGVDPAPITQARFPCGKPEAMDAAEFYDWSNPTVIEQGIIGPPVEFQCSPDKGCAVHGGGSCQFSITNDTIPTADSVFHVIQSYEGGCLSLDGTPYDNTQDPLSYPDKYAFAIPESIAPGNYTYAWSWVPKYSALPEFYMNCAPITVTKKPGSPDTPNGKQLPEMFVLNVPGISDCTNDPGHDLLYPDPGVFFRIGSDGNGCDTDVFKYAQNGADCHVPAPADQYLGCALATNNGTQSEQIHRTPTSHATGGADALETYTDAGVTSQTVTAASSVQTTTSSASPRSTFQTRASSPTETSTSSSQLPSSTHLALSTQLSSSTQLFSLAETLTSSTHLSSSPHLTSSSIVAVPSSSSSSFTAAHSPATVVDGCAAATMKLTENHVFHGPCGGEEGKSWNCIHNPEGDSVQQCKNGTWSAPAYLLNGQKCSSRGVSGPIVLL